MYEKVGWKIVLIIVVVGMAFFFMFPPFTGIVPPSLQNKIFGKWPPSEGKLSLGEDLKGGQTMVLSVPNASQRNDVIEVLNRRVNNSGLKEIYVSALGDRQIQVRAPAGATGLRDLLMTTGTLDFRLEVPNTTYQEYETANQAAIAAIKAGEPLPPSPPGMMLEQGKDNEGKTITGLNNRPYLLLYERSEFNAKDFTDFGLTMEKGKPAVRFTVTASSASRFEEATQSLIDEKETAYGKEHGRLAVFVNGKFESAPVVISRISDNGVITLGGGSDVQKRAKELLIALQSGALSTQINFESEIQTGPAIGEDSLRRGIMSMILSAALVLVFMAVYYLALGVVADFAMMLNIPLILGALCAFQATFTLPGFAGLILTLGMSVDANILIYERIREERAAGKGIEGAFKAGYDRAFTTIIDSHITTLIVGLILLWKGSGPIRGFGITLTVGIATSLFTSLLITKVIFTVLIKKGWLKEAHMQRWVKRPHVPWMKIRKIAITCSIILSVIGMGFFAARGSANFGIDFLGGAQYQVALTTPMQIEDVRGKLTAIMPPNANPEVQSVQSGTTEGTYAFIIRMPQDVIYQIARGNGLSPDAGADKVVDLVKGKLTELFHAEFPPEGFDKSKSLEESKFSQMTGTFKATPTTPDFWTSLNEVVKKFNQPPVNPSEDQKKREEWAITFTKMDYLGRDLDATVQKIQAACKENDIEFIPKPTNLSKDPNPIIVLYATFEIPGEVKGNAAAKAEFLGRIRDLVKETIAKNTANERIGVKAYSVQDVVMVPLVAAGGAAEAAVAGPVAIGQKEYARYRIEVLCTENYDTALTKVQTVLAKNLPEAPVALPGIKDPQPVVVSPGGIPGSTTVTSSVAQSIRFTAVVSLVLAMVGIIIYVWFRFRSFRYGFGAVVALLHDVTVAIGVVALLDTVTPLNIKFDLPMVAALLTIIGYSVMDTIVVFDRIRENLGLHRDTRLFIENVDTSINQTLTRTIFTSLTVFLTVFTLAILGGDMVRGFAVTMCIGVFVGTYSSIFIASPIVVWLHNREMKALGMMPTTVGAQK